MNKIRFNKSVILLGTFALAMAMSAGCKEKGYAASESYDKNGNLTSAVYSSVDLSKVRDHATEGCAVAESCKKSCKYDKSGRLVSEEDNDGKSVYSYDSNGNLASKSYTDKKLKKAMGLKKYAEDWTYAPDGKVSAIKKDNGEQTWETRYEYDAQGNLVLAIDVEGGKTTEVEKWSYGYDSNGNMVSKKYLLGEGEYSYEYDAGGKLVRSVENGSESVYEYDAAGNLVHQKKGSEDFTWSYDGK